MLRQHARQYNALGLKQRHGQLQLDIAARRSKQRRDRPSWMLKVAQDYSGTEEPVAEQQLGTSGCPVLRQLKQVEEYKANKWLTWYKLLYTDVFNFQSEQLQGRPIVKGNAHMPAYLVGDNKLARELLSDDELFDASAMGHGRIIGWEGLQFLKGETHTLLRGKMAHAFAPDNIEQYTPQVQEVAVKVVKRMVEHSAQAGPKGIRGADYFKAFTFEVICRVVAGLHLSEEEMKAMREDFVDMVGGIMIEIQPIDVLKKEIPFMPGSRYWPAAKRIRQRIEQILEKSRKAAASGEASTSSRPSVILSLANLKDNNGDPIPDNVLVDNLLLFFLAGFDTSSNALAAMAYFVHHHPEHWQTVVDEQAALQAQYGSVMDPKILRKMSATERFVKETLRLRMPVPHMSRNASTDTELGGYFIPAGTRMYLPLQYIARTEPLWENETGELDPAKFNPDRFKGVTGGLTHQIAFGSGPHVCIGMSLALTEMKVWLAVLARGYKVKMVEEPVWTNTPIVQPLNGLPVVVERG